MIAQTKRSIRFILSFSVFYLGLNYLWISYNSLILPTQVLYAFSAELRGIALGAIASGGVLIGVFMNLISGIISDGMITRIGRRRPLIIAGVAGLIPVMITAALFPPFGPLVASEYLLMQIFSNMAQGSFQPLLPDLFPRTQRGEAGGFLGLFTLIGNALGYGLTGLLIGLGRLSASCLTVLPFMLVPSAISLYTVWRHDAPSGAEGKGLMKALKELFRPRERSPGFFWLVMGSFFVLLGPSGLMYFELYYFKYVLVLKNPAFGVAITGLVVLLVAMTAAVGLGKLSDRVGRKMLLIYAGIAGGFFMSLIPFLRFFYLFLLGAAAVGATTGIFSSIMPAFAGDLSPPRATGQYMAYSNLAIGGSSAVAPIVDGAVIYLLGSSFTGFMTMFLLSGLFYFIGSTLLLRTPRG